MPELDHDLEMMFCYVKFKNGALPQIFSI